MSKQMNQIETPEEKKKGNFWSFMSLICFVSRFIVNIVIMVLVSGAELMVEAYQDLNRITDMISTSSAIIGGGIEILLSIATLVIIIYVRVKYPKNIFGKVLMWIYIVLFVMYVVIMAAMIIAIGIACGACLDDCSKMGKIIIESRMLC